MHEQYIKLKWEWKIYDLKYFYFLFLKKNLTLYIIKNNFLFSFKKKILESFFWLNNKKFLKIYTIIKLMFLETIFKNKVK